MKGKYLYIQGFNGDYSIFPSSTITFAPTCALKPFLVSTIPPFLIYKDEFTFNMNSGLEITVQQFIIFNVQAKRTKHLSTHGHRNKGDGNED